MTQNKDWKAEKRKQARDERIRKAKTQPKPEEPPNSPEAEQGVLGCILLAATTVSKELKLEASTAQVDAMLMQLKSAHFYDLRHACVFDAMRMMRVENNAIDMITLQQWLKDKKQLESVGGLAYLAGLPDATPSQFNFPEYLAILRDKAHRRWLLKQSLNLTSLANASDLKLEDTQAHLAEIYDATAKATDQRATLKIWRVHELAKYQPPATHALIGDNEIRMGVEGLVLVAGPGGSGKSLSLTSLALAGAIGSGTWMGRKVHRQFKTLFIQAENGATRLKKELEALQANHPKVNLHDHIFISDPPAGGIPFHRAEFRQAVRREVETIQPSLVILDPWSRVAADDGSKDIVDKLSEIYSCFPGGEKCPGLIISAHTKKPRPEDVRKGRALANLISGSIALKDSARCVYMLLPWSEETEDQRIYWCCAKLNDGEMYAASVWRRRFGTHFEHDEETDPRTWGEEAEKKGERRTITVEMVQEVFAKSKRPGMKRSEMVKLLCEYFPKKAKSQTAWRALGKDGYALEWLDEVAGVVSLKEEFK